MNKWIGIAALIAGGLLTFAFAPFQIIFFSFISPAILLGLWQRQNAKHAFFSGWLFGVGFFAGSSSWVFISIYHFGNASVELAGLITTLFIIALGLYFAIMGFLFRYFFSEISDTKQCLLGFPMMWVAIEFLRSTLFTGFPWVLLGNAQTATPLSGFAPVFGVYGLSLITAIMSGALLLIFKRANAKIIIICLLIIFGFPSVGYALKKIAWTKPFSQPIKISLIQGNIPQATKWAAELLIRNINIYKTLTAQHWDSELIVWPEGAFPVFAQDAPKIISDLSAQAAAHNSNVLFGVPISMNDHYFNGVLLIGKNQGEYLKRHLVPFGEYTPLPTIFGKVMQHFNIPMSDFARGPRDQASLTLGDVRIAPFLCYEIAFPFQVLRHARHSELLVTLSDDSWFGRSIALAQHLQIAVLRSMETGRPQLLDTNTGITAFISEKGDVIAQAPRDQRGVITKIIQPMTGETPLMRWNNYPVFIILMLMLVFSASRGKQRENQ